MRARGGRFKSSLLSSRNSSYPPQWLMDMDIKYMAIVYNPSACSGTPSLYKLQRAEPLRCLALRTRGGRFKSSLLSSRNSSYPPQWLMDMGIKYMAIYGMCMYTCTVYKTKSGTNYKYIVSFTSSPRLVV